MNCTSRACLCLKSCTTLYYVLNLGATSKPSLIKLGLWTIVFINTAAGAVIVVAIVYTEWCVCTRNVWYTNKRIGLSSEVQIQWLLYKVTRTYFLKKRLLLMFGIQKLVLRTLQPYCDEIFKFVCMCFIFIKYFN